MGEGTKLTDRKRGWDQGRKKEQDDGRHEKIMEVEEGDETEGDRGELVAIQTAH